MLIKKTVLDKKMKKYYTSIPMEQGTEGPRKGDKQNLQSDAGSRAKGHWEYL